MKLSVSAYRAHASAHKKILDTAYQLNYGSTSASHHPTTSTGVTPFQVQVAVLTIKLEQVSSEGLKTVAISNQLLLTNLNRKQLNAEFFAFFYQTARMQPKFPAAGVFNINYKMLFMLVNLIANYMIIMTQFLKKM